MVTVSSEGGSAAQQTTNTITQVIQTVLAAQLVGRIDSPASEKE
jgi:hypothetical protein